MPPNRDQEQLDEIRWPFSVDLEFAWHPFYDFFNRLSVSSSNSSPQPGGVLLLGRLDHPFPERLGTDHPPIEGRFERFGRRALESLHNESPITGSGFSG